MSLPLPPEREGPTRRRRAGEGLSVSRDDVDKAYDPAPTRRARELRNGATAAERRLWAVLANRQLAGVRFNRQVVIRPYICDFVARGPKLVVEIDGGQHAEQVAYDARRTQFLEARGYRVLRFWNDDVMHNLTGVAQLIARTLEDMPSPSRLRRSSPPAGGKGEIG